MALVRAEAERVGEHRRVRPCRVLLVDETSIRRRHRYVTVVACGESGEVLAMIPGRGRVWDPLLQRPRTLVVSGCGDRRVRRFPPLSGSHLTVSARCPPCLGPVPRSAVPHPKGSPWCEGSSNAAIPTTHLLRMSRTCSGRDTHSCAERQPQRSPPGASRSALRGLSTAANGLRRSPRTLPTLRSRRPGTSQRGSGTVRGPLRHRPDTTNTTTW